MRSACPTAMTTSRLTLRSLPTRSSSFDLASGRITNRSKSKLTVDAVDTFSGFGDRKSTRLNSSHDQISYAVFCLKKKKLTSTALCEAFAHVAVRGGEYSSA